MKHIIAILLLITFLRAGAQENLPVTDSLPAVYNGLKAGYAITGQSEKEVSNKGNFSRYKIKFFVRNTGSEAKIFLPKQEFLNTGSAAHDLVQFKCANATGARLTNKEITLQMQPCKIEAMVEEKECTSDKTVQNKRIADIGYWIKPGESITANSILIVPLNEKPLITATFYPNNNGIVGNVTRDGNTNNTNNNYTQSFVRIKNFSSNDYLHVQDGPLACSKIDLSWWSAQWELVPVNGTVNFQIRNRWKNNFLSAGAGSMLSDDSRNINTMWILQESNLSNVYFIKNVSGNSKLIFQNGALKTSYTYHANDAIAEWIIEK